MIIIIELLDLISMRTPLSIIYMIYPSELNKQPFKKSRYLIVSLQSIGFNIIKCSENPFWFNTGNMQLKWYLIASSQRKKIIFDLCLG